MVRQYSSVRYAWTSLDAIYSAAIEALVAALEAIAEILGHVPASRDISNLPTVSGGSDEAARDSEAWLLSLASSEYIWQVASRLPTSPRRFLLDWLDTVRSVHSSYPRFLNIFHRRQ